MENRIVAASDIATRLREVFSFFFNKIGRSSSRRHMQRLEVEAHCAIFDPPE
jgi:hypothetical protein